MPPSTLAAPDEFDESPIVAGGLAAPGEFEEQGAAQGVPSPQSIMDQIRQASFAAAKALPKPPTTVKEMTDMMDPLGYGKALQNDPKAAIEAARGFVRRPSQASTPMEQGHYEAFKNLPVMMASMMAPGIAAPEAGAAYAAAVPEAGASLAGRALWGAGNIASRAVGSGLEQGALAGGTAALQRAAGGVASDLGAGENTGPSPLQAAAEVAPSYAKYGAAVPAAIETAGAVVPPIWNGAKQMAQGAVENSSKLMSGIAKEFLDTLSNQGDKVMEYARMGSTMDPLAQKEVPVALLKAQEMGRAAQNAIESASDLAGEEYSQMMEHLKQDVSGERFDVAGKVYDKMEPYI